MLPATALLTSGPRGTPLGRLGATGATSGEKEQIILVIMYTYYAITRGASQPAAAPRMHVTVGGVIGKQRQ